MKINIPVQKAFVHTLYIEFQRRHRNSNCVCLSVSDFQLSKPLSLKNGLRYRVEIWHTTEVVTPL